MKVNRFPKANRKFKKTSIPRPNDKALRASLCLACSISLKSSVLKSRNRKEGTDYLKNGPHNILKQETYPASLSKEE